MKDNGSKHTELESPLDDKLYEYGRWNSGLFVTRLKQILTGLWGVFRDSILSLKVVFVFT